MISTSTRRRRESKARGRTIGGRGGVFFKAVSRFKLIAGKWERERERERVDYMIILYIILFNKIQVFGGSMGSSVFPI